MNAPHSFYHPDTYRPENSIGYQINRLSQSVARELDRRMSNLDLTDAQWKPLLLLRQGTCTTAADIARLACHDTGAITRVLDRLEAKELIRRVRSETDRRVINLELTESGAVLATEIPRILAEVMNHVLIGFDQDEFTVFRALLQRALRNAQTLGTGKEGGAA